MKKPKQLFSSFLFQKQLLHDYQTSKTSFSCEYNEEKEELHTLFWIYENNLWIDESLMSINRMKSSEKNAKKGL